MTDRYNPLCTASKARCLDHWVHLGAEAKADLVWWETFLQLWNQQSMMEVHNPLWKPDITFSSDASGNWGCGASWGNAWIQLAWSAEWRECQIAIKELLPVVLACVIWWPQWQHKQVLVLCDNAAVVQILNAKSSREKTIMHLLRCLHFFCALADIKLRAEHLPGVKNTIADAISRNNLQVLFSILPTACHAPSPIPPVLLQLLAEKHLTWLSPTWRDLLKSLWQTVWLPVPGDHTGLPNPDIWNSVTK